MMIPYLRNVVINGISLSHHHILNRMALTSNNYDTNHYNYSTVVIAI